MRQLCIRFKIFLSIEGGDTFLISPESRIDIFF
jgi:hypothetical protein